jgi:hypothetical protein
VISIQDIDRKKLGALFEPNGLENFQSFRIRKEISGNHWVILFKSSARQVTLIVAEILEDLAED